MIFDSIEQIKELYEHPATNLTHEKDKHRRYRMHVHGVGLKAYIQQITGVEDDEAIKLRQKYTRSNKDLFSNLLRPVDKVFSAKGKSKIYDTSGQKTTDELRTYLHKVDNGKSLEAWEQSYWTDKIAIDPNGVFLVERDSEGNPYPTYKCILGIRDYVQVGQKLDYIIFEPNDLGEGKQSVRVYDDAEDALYIIENGKWTKDDEQSYPNSLGEVPAVVISTFEDTLTGLKRSSIDTEVELADEVLRDNSVKSVYKLKHGFPVFWMHTPTCKVCNGTKEYKGEPCPACNGTGLDTRKTVESVYNVKPPVVDTETGEVQPSVAPDVAGYVVAPSEVLEQMRIELEDLRKMMWRSQWNTVIESGKNETATGRFIDAQPVSDRLDNYRGAIETVEMLLVGYIGRMLLGGAYKNASINYGSRYMIETPDQLFDKYKEGKQAGLNDIILNQRLDDYYNSVYATDAESYLYYTKLRKLEPWPHVSLGDVPQGLTGLPMYQTKIYFNDWVSSIERQEVILKKLKQLKKELNTYVEQKLKDNGNLQRVSPDSVQSG